MKTVITESPEEAADFIRRKGTVAFPTETVYGLGADIFDEMAVEKIFRAKDRPSDNPLIAHVATKNDIDRLGEVSPWARLLIDKFVPGPLTVVVRKASAVPAIATAGLDTIGIRMPRNDVAKRFLAACGTPVAAPSANLSGRPSPTTWQAVAEDLDGRIDCILRGDPTEIGLESTVVDCTGEVPIILRSGSVSLEQIAAVIPSVEKLGELVVGAAKSPGLKHQHYAPRARVSIWKKGDEMKIEAGPAAFIGIHQPDGDLGYVKICRSVEVYARSVFEFFRECDRRGVEQIFCEEVPETGLGAALIDRLRRAAAAS